MTDKITNSLHVVLCLALSLGGGCFSLPEVGKTPPMEPEFCETMARAQKRAGEGEYALAGILYRQALDRALKLDLSREIRFSALCCAAYALNEEEWEEAEWALGVAAEVRPPSVSPSLREVDLSLRLAWARGKRGEKLRDALASGVEEEGGWTPEVVDARLTLMEEKLRRGEKAAPLQFPAGWQETGFPLGIRIRADILQAWSGRDAPAWMSRASAYARAGNTSAAINEALRCARILHHREAAQLALRLAVGAHDTARAARARELLRGWK